jgi:hypothetical protein
MIMVMTLSGSWKPRAGDGLDQMRLLLVTPADLRKVRSRTSRQMICSFGVPFVGASEVSPTSICGSVSTARAIARPCQSATKIPLEEYREARKARVQEAAFGQPETYTGSDSASAGVGPGAGSSTRTSAIPPNTNKPPRAWRRLGR